MVRTDDVRVGRRLLAAAVVITASVIGGALSGSSPASAATLTINLFAGPANQEYGQPLGASAILSADPQGGTVTFYADNVPIPNCTNLPAGIAAIYCNYRWLDPATYDIRAEFNGSPSYDPASSQTEQQRVYQANTDITYTGPTSVFAGQQFQATAALKTSYWEREIVGESVTFSFAAGDSCVGTTDATGTVECSITMPAFGATLTIDYAGSVGYAPETITASITAQSATTTTTLSVSPLGGPVGTPILLHASVDPSVATGTVDFRNGVFNVPGCSGVALVGGEASCTTADLPVGTHSLSALYHANVPFDGSISTATNVTMTAHATSLVPGGALTGTVGTPYQLFAGLVDDDVGGPVVGETVTMQLGSQSCTGTTNALGRATCSVTPTTAGTKATTMTFAGTPTLQPSTATGTQVIIGQSATTTSATSAGGEYLAPVHIDAVVAPSDGAGTVAFFAGTLITGCSSVPLTLVTGDWTARCTTSALAVGSHPVTALFSGSANYQGSTSPSANVVVAPASTATVATGPDTALYAGSATYTATVTPNPGSGTVAFKTAGGGTLGCEAEPLDAAGQATCTVALITLGTNTIRATFSGNSSYATSFGDWTVTVDPAPTTLAYSGPTSGVVGEPVTVTATLTAHGRGVEPGQAVLFSLDAGGSCTGTTDGIDGVASCALIPIAATDHGELNVSYAGSTHYLASATDASMQIAAATTETTLTGPASAEFGDAVQLVATVALTNGAGTVAFTLDGDAIAGCNAVALVGPAPWQATCTAVALPAGPLEIVATYGGTPDYLTSADDIAVDIVAADVMAGYAGDTAGTVGAPINLSGALEAELGGGSSPVAGQTLTFTLADLSCTAVTDVAGAASCAVTPTTVAQSGTVTVAFAGTAEFAAASATGTVAISPAASVTTVSGPASALFSVPVTLVATVAPTNGGTVAFHIGGGAVPGCDAVPVAESAGAWQASCTTSSLPVGTQTVTAGYSGTADYLPSTSEAVTVLVGVAPTSLTYTGPQTATAGEPLTVSAQLLVDQSSSSATPLTAGAIVPLASRAVTLAVVPLAAGDVPVGGQMLTFQLVDASCTATTDATGTASCVLTPSASASSSELRITFAGGAGFAAAEEVVAVAVAAAPIPPPTPAPAAPTTPPTPGTLPATGGNGTPIGQLAAALLIAGLLAIGMTCRGRRRYTRP